MSQLIYLSRNFVEFGAFKPEEILDFKNRGILVESDYVRLENDGSWLPLEQWVSNGATAPAPATATSDDTPPPAPKKAKSTTAKKKTGAKKAA